MQKELFIANGFSYSEKEEIIISEIRAMPEGENKDFAIKFFEGLSGKKFPVSEPIEISLNIDTAFIGSLSSKRISAEVLSNGLISRRGSLL